MDNTFVDWSKAQIRYRAGYDLSLYPFIGTFNKNIDDENDYFRFVEEVDPNGEDEIRYQSQLNYLETLATSYQIMGNIADTYSTNREELQKDGLSNFPIMFAMLKKRPKNTEREFLMAYLYRQNTVIPAKYQDSLSYFANTDLVAQVSASEASETADIITLLERYAIPESEKSALLLIYQEAKGKVVFHDFWFTNCAPCMKEMPHYNDLIATTDSNAVEFVFYGAYMDHEEWQKTINRFKLKGKQHLPAKNQLAFFERYFKVHGFPHHRLLRADGTIGEEVRYDAYPTNFDAINEQIDKHKTKK